MKAIGASAEPKIPDSVPVRTAAPDELAEERTLCEVRLAKVDLTEADLTALHATDVEFDACNLANATMPNIAFYRVVLVQSKLSGVQVTKATFTDVRFRGCRLDFATFNQVKFKSVTFEDCQLREADFAGVTLDHVSFVDCDLTRATFAGVQLKRTELRRCELGELRGLTALRGVEMEAGDIVANAELFAEELGIRVRGRLSKFDGEVA
jgi:uncharacterized protein YjbI with pentapeptide repeats